MRYGRIEDNIVVVISFIPQPDFVEVPDDVFAGYCCTPDGGYCPPSTSLDDCKATKIKSITSEYDTLVYAGFTSEGVSYESTLENQSLIMMANMAGGGMVIDGGKMVTLDAGQANQVFVDMNAYVNGCNERYATAQDSIEEATTNEQVNAVVL